MTEMTVSEIMKHKRLVERVTSLDRLAKATEKNKATIKKYEDEELMIPTEVAEDLAAVYFGTEAERVSFIELCNQERRYRRNIRSERSRRKKECTKASKYFEARLRIFPLIREPATLVETDEKNMVIKETPDPHHRYSRTLIAVNLIEKREQRVVGTIHAESFVFYEYENGKPKALQARAVDGLLAFSDKRKIGRYALIDLAAKKLRATDFFNVSKYAIGDDDSGNSAYLIDTRTTDGIISFLDDALRQSSKEKIRKSINKAKAHLEFVKSRSNEVIPFKEKLSRQIQKLERRIASKSFSHS